MIDLRRRYLTLDRYMSGSFWRLFLWTIALSAVGFIILWLLAYKFIQWTPGDAFLQLTNPTKHDSAGPGEWPWIVCLNMFGLFVLNGVILTLFVNWVSNRKERHTNGQARYPFLHSRRFAAIIGGHKIAAGLAKSLITDGKLDYVIIQTQRPAEVVRKEVFAEFDSPRLAHNVIIYSGDRTSRHELAELRLDRASEIYIVGEPYRIDGSSHDALNLQCWQIINSLALERQKRRQNQSGKQIPCHIMFEYQSTFSAFQFTDPCAGDCNAFRFIPFNINEVWAQRVLIGDSPEYIPLDGRKGLQYDSGRRVHLIVVGMTQMGVALALEAAHLAHYPNFNNDKAGNPRTLITFIDRDAKREMQFLAGRYRELFQLVRHRFVKAPDTAETSLYQTSAELARGAESPWPWRDPMTDASLGSPYCGGYLGKRLVDIDFEFIEGDVALPSIQKYISDACADCNSESGGEHDRSSITTIAVCQEAANEAMSAALYFAPDVYENAQEILVYQSESDALVNAVRLGVTGSAGSKYGILRPFGMSEKCDYITRSKSLLPKIVNYIYNLHQENKKFHEEYASLGECKVLEKIEEDWLSINSKNGKSAIAKRWSNMYSANSFLCRVRSAGEKFSETEGFKDQEILQTLAEAEHNRWSMEQLLLGYRPLGPEYASRIQLVDDTEAEALKSRKIHPNLISYELLKDITRQNDLNIIREIPLALSISYGAF